MPPSPPDGVILRPPSRALFHRVNISLNICPQSIPVILFCMTRGIYRLDIHVRVAQLVERYPAQLLSLWSRVQTPLLLRFYRQVITRRPILFLACCLPNLMHVEVYYSLLK